MPIIESVTGPKIATAEYDFAVDGGAVSTITLRSVATDSVGAAIPNGAVIVGGYINVLTTFTSGGSATVGINVETAGDIKAAATTFGTYAAGFVATVPAFATGQFKTTAARAITITIATAALTAGKMRVVLMYV